MEKVIKKTNSVRAKLSPFLAVLLAVLCLYTIVMLSLMLWGVLTALKSQWDFRDNKVGFPDGAPWAWAFSNFETIFKNFIVDTSVRVNGVPQLKKVYIEQMILNTFLYAGVGAVIQAVVPCVVAYMTCTFKYKFSKVVNTFVIAAMVIPIVGQQATELQFLRTLGLFDTFIGNWIQKFHFLGMYYLVFYAAFKGVSKEFSEAAYIDGASELTVMVRIVMPMVRTVILTVILIKFIEFWNDYQTPLLYLPSHPTLAFGVYSLSVSTNGALANTPMRLACCVIMAVPILVLFIVFRKRLIGNLSMGGVKE